MTELFSPLQNLDLLSVGIASAGMIILGFVTLFNSSKSITNRVLFYLTISASIWGIVNYFSYVIDSPDLSFSLLRLVLFISIWSSLFTYTLIYVFPKEDIQFSKYYKYLLVPTAIITAALTLTPFVLSKVSQFSLDNHIEKVTNGPGIILYGLVIAFLNFGAIFQLIKKIGKANEDEAKPLRMVLVGMLIMLMLIIFFNFIQPALLDDSQFIKFGALFQFPFIALTAFAIIKHRLFRIKVIGPALLVFVLSVVSFLEIIYAGNNLSLVLFRSGTFILILLFGVLLIRNVMKEIFLREQLQVANEGQSNLIHIMNHQIKGYLSKSRSIFGELLTGDYGQFSDEAKPLLHEGLNSLTEGVNFVHQILQGSSAESGKLIYNFENFDFKDMVQDVAHVQSENAKSKNLDFKVNLEDGSYNMRGDKIQLKESVKNLIDNSITYTPQGEVVVTLSSHNNKVLLSVKDTGVGITSEDKQRLFTKGGRGKDSLKINVNSTGYGLAFVKAVVDAHNGRVWVESPGKDRGSTFFMELPLS